MNLLIAGISVAEPNELGTDAAGHKNFRDQAERIGQSLVSHCGREMAVKIGAWGIEMLRDLPAFYVDGETLRLTALAWELIDDKLLHGIQNNPKLSPLTTPPVPWTQVRTGGLPDDWASEPLIRPCHPSIERAVRYAIGAGKMHRVLAALNALQNVPFTINKHVLDFMLSEGVPPLPKGNTPEGWQKRFAQWWAAVNESNSFITDTAFAASSPIFWVALNLDFRGRIYGISHFNFAREDRVRGLFLFAKGAAIGVEGLRWLKAHVARSANGNQWSNDARPGDLEFEDRIKWTEDHIGQLRAIGEQIMRGDYHGLKDWALPKDRYQFIAAVCELVQALHEGPTFPTRLPVMFDASASGMQHMLAIMKAETGRFVNIVAGCEPDDLYRRVAFLVHKYSAEARRHMGPLDRAIIKVAAVPWFYGSKPGGWNKKEQRWVGMAKPIVEELTDRAWKKHPKEYAHHVFAFHKNVVAAEASKIAHAIDKAINKLVPEAAVLRKWLRSLAKECAEIGKPLHWETPPGLPVINAYYETIEKNISTKFNGKRRRVKLVIGNTGHVSEADALKGAAANYIHSVDATHLQMIVLAAAAKGIEMASVHDCFGTIAPDAARLREIIGDTFEELHQGNHLIDGLWASAKKVLRRDPPPKPKIGTAKIKPIFKAFS